VLNGIVYTDKDKCEACSACLRMCRTKSIKIKDGKSEIIRESCLNCGACIKACSKGAKRYISSIENTWRLLETGAAALVLAPSYVIVAAKKYRCSTGQFCAALKELGFAYIYESSFGADVVTRVYTDYLNDHIEQKGREDTHVITSPCAALMNYVEKHVPALLEQFAPVLSPMAAQALLVKRWNDCNTAVVGASPCIAKKSELLDKNLGLFDEALTFEELIQMLDSRKIDPPVLEESEFDGIQAFYGAAFPISGGLTKTMEMFTGESGFNPVGSDYLILEGEGRAVKYLGKMARDKLKDGDLAGYPLLVDILYCEGCIMGKAMGVESDFRENRRIIAQYAQSRFQMSSSKELAGKYKGYSVVVKNTVQAPEFAAWLDTVEQLLRENSFARRWNNRHYDKKVPDEDQIKAILEHDGKYSASDELNCGACGYETCRDRAVAVFNGENEAGGCIVHIKYEAKINLEENKRLQELDRMKSDFLSTVSHELRTPLTSVLGFSKIIKNRLEDLIFPLVKSDEKKVNRAVGQVSDNLNIIISESQRLTSMINDVLDLSKLEAGRIEWKMEPLSPAEVIGRAASATAALFDQKGIELVLDIEDGLPLVEGDLDRLIQTAINLFSNAVKFTGQGGTVTCGARADRGSVIISVTDTGIGIAGQDLEKVFEKFRQVGDTLTDKPKGTGLGLPICRQIVEQHGGSIWVESQLGRGSTFSFSLPVFGAVDSSPEGRVALPVKRAEQVSTEPERAKGQKSILVVDDDTNIRMLLRQELEEAGYSVREAAGGMEAIGMVKQEKADLIILDVMMPGINGFDVAAVLKNDPATLQIPIIILSIVEDKERGCRIGVDSYFTKPLNAVELLNEIAVLIARGGAREKVLVVDDEIFSSRGPGKKRG